MAINYRKIKSQIHCKKYGNRMKYFFDVTAEQSNDEVMPIAAWNKKQLLEVIAYFTNHDVDWKGDKIESFSKHFKI